jgi:hypothetical protein
LLIVIVVRQRVELLIAATMFFVVGLVLFPIALVVTDDVVIVVTVAVVGALGIGFLLHAIERPRRLANLGSASTIPNEGTVEGRLKTAYRQGVLVLGPAILVVLVMSLGWNNLTLTPGAFFGAALWLWRDARLLRAWEADHHAEVFRRADWGFTWLRRDGDIRFIMRTD